MLCFHVTLPVDWTASASPGNFLFDIVAIARDAWEFLLVLCSGWYQGLNSGLKHAKYMLQYLKLSFWPGEFLGKNSVLDTPQSCLRICFMTRPPSNSDAYWSLIRPLLGCDIWIPMVLVSRHDSQPIQKGRERSEPAAQNPDMHPLLMHLLPDLKNRGKAECTQLIRSQLFQSNLLKSSSLFTWEMVIFQAHTNWVQVIGCRCYLMWPPDLLLNYLLCCWVPRADDKTQREARILQSFVSCSHF